MKILIQNPTEPILEGIAQTLVSIGESLIIWDSKTQPLNDLLDRYKPELLIGYDNSSQHFPKMKKVLISGSPLNPCSVCISNPPEPDIYLVVETAANFVHNDVQHDENYATDLFYYSQNTTPEILEYLLEIEKDYQLKIIGPHRIPLSSYLGAGTTTDIVKFMRSCKIALVFDLPSLYTYAANKVFCVTNQGTSLFPHIDLLSESMVEYKSEVIDNYVEKAYNYVISDHTYFHRTYDILTHLGYTEQAEKCLTTLKNMISKN